MYESLEGANLKIMGYPFYVEKVSADNAIRRREFNWNGLVGGTSKVSKGAYVPLEFTVTTHVMIDSTRPDIHNKIFEEMMSKPVVVSSPEIGGTFKAIVVITPGHEKQNWLELSIKIKEVPGKDSLIPGESFVVPATKKIDVKKKNKTPTGKGTDKDKKTIITPFNKRNSAAKKTKGK